MTMIRRYIASVAMVALMVGALFAASPVSAALTFPTVADLEAGDLFKTDDSSTVYYFGADELRYGFPNENTYFTWYDDFDDVVTITSTEMNLIPFSGMVTYFPHFDGMTDTRLLQITGQEEIYVSLGLTMLIEVEDEDDAAVLFGDDWADRVDVLPDVFVSHYIITGGNIDDDSEFDEVPDDGYSISDDMELVAPVGVMIYEDPLRFAVSDESVCDDDYCAYNELTVEQGDTIKFVNYAEEEVRVREENNEWTTGPMGTEDVVVLTVDSEPGEYYFYGNSDDDIVGILTVE